MCFWGKILYLPNPRSISCTPCWLHLLHRPMSFRQSLSWRQMMTHLFEWMKSCLLCRGLTWLVDCCMVLSTQIPILIGAQTASGLSVQRWISSSYLIVHRQFHPLHSFSIHQWGRASVLAIDHGTKITHSWSSALIRIESCSFVDVKEWPEETYPPWAHGPGYVVSSDIAKTISSKQRKGRLKVKCTTVSLYLFNCHLSEWSLRLKM